MWQPIKTHLQASFKKHSFLDKAMTNPVCGTAVGHAFFWLANREASHRCAMVFCLLGTEERTGGNWREGDIQLNHQIHDAWMDAHFHDGWITRLVICQKTDGMDGRGWMDSGKWKYEQIDEYICQIVNLDQSYWLSNQKVHNG